ncbi:MAG: hypothetical protein K0R28_3225, partial [Paenibacillus sp.]|nr:hypothetical protein [Paenibacillus sp.]
FKFLSIESANCRLKIRSYSESTKLPTISVGNVTSTTKMAADFHFRLNSRKKTSSSPASAYSTIIVHPANDVAGNVHHMTRLRQARPRALAITQPLTAPAVMPCTNCF